MIKIKKYLKDSGCGGEKNISRLGSVLRPSGKHGLPAPKRLAGKRKSGSRYVA
ncbi:hypothetical protein [Brevibacillus formosus]|uniref:hypothetical protein n=1 Tax=Brevibacillus formosus TaxID=54913 RepID=UPI0012FD44DC|nr:hypothetical protein [Brevibacillus formosus]